VCAAAGPGTVVRRLAALRAASGAYAPSLQVVRRSSGPGNSEPNTVVRGLAALQAASGLAPPTTGVR
jgi:hypothetical protein